MLEKSWVKPFSEKLFPFIDESSFAWLYSNKTSRPNIPRLMCVLELSLSMTDDGGWNPLHLISVSSMCSIQQVLKSSRFLIRHSAVFENAAILMNWQMVLTLFMKPSSGFSVKWQNLWKSADKSRGWILLWFSHSSSYVELLYTCLSDFAVYLHK